MQFITDQEVVGECEKLGDAVVEARLNSGYFANNPTPALEWLLKRRQEAERMQRRAEMRNTQLALFASWVMAAITLIGILWQKEDNQAQRELAKAQLEQQREDSKNQRNDAKTLLGVQISVELDKQFDSPEMRQARRRLATQLLAHKNITDTRVFDFFDKLAMYTHQGYLDQDTVYQSYSYWIERYWPTAKPFMEKFRSQEKDSGYYEDFEDLYNEMITDDKKDGHAAPSPAEVQRFLKEEEALLL